MKSFFIALLVLLMGCSTYGQNRPLRVGVKFGFPQFVGLNIEHSSPLLDGRLAFAVELSSLFLRFTTSPENQYNIYLTSSMYGASGNYYFYRKDRGLYASMGLYRYVFGLYFPNHNYRDDYWYSERALIKANVFDLGLGVKWGNSFYFRAEAGYGIHIGSSASNWVTGDNVTWTKTQHFTNENIWPIKLNIGFGFGFGKSKGTDEK